MFTTVVDTSLQSTLIPFSLKLLIIITDISGEVEVRKNWNIVWLKLYGDSSSVLASDEIIRLSGGVTPGIISIQTSVVTAVRHVRFSCSPGHTEMSADCTLPACVHYYYCNSYQDHMKRRKINLYLSYCYLHVYLMMAWQSTRSVHVSIHSSWSRPQW